MMFSKHFLMFFLVFCVSFVIFFLVTFLVNFRRIYVQIIMSYPISILIGIRLQQHGEFIHVCADKGKYAVYIQYSRK